MFSVARHLQQQAMREADDREKDLFARSFFNRYYYALFLDTQNILKDYISGLTKIAHKNVPEVLKGSVVKLLDKQRQSASKIGDIKTVNKCLTAKSLTLELADIFNIAYGVRCVADYEQYKLIDFMDGSGFRLQNVKIQTAASWENRLSAWRSAIRAAMK